MEKNNTLDQQNKNEKLYTTNCISIATFFGGPLAGAYLMSKNFENLDKNDYAQNALKIGVVATLLLGLLLFIPESIMNQLPESIIPIFYSSVIYSLMLRYQDKEIKEHLKNNGATHSGWKAAGITILCFLVTMLYMFAFLMLYFSIKK